MDYSVAASVVGAGLSSMAISWFIHHAVDERRNTRKLDPEKWEQIGNLQEISIYPLRTAAAVVLEQAMLDKHGICVLDICDSRLFLTTDQGEVITACKYPIMLGIKTTIISNNVIEMTAPEATEPLRLDIKNLTKNGCRFNTNINGKLMRLVSCTNNEHKWFSQVILRSDEGIRLNIVLDKQSRKFWWGDMSLWVSSVSALLDKSVEDLNKRLQPSDQITHKRFHSNLFIKSNYDIEAYDEDKWMWMKVGNKAILQFRSAYLHKILVNINTETFERSKNFQPLKELKTYRAITKSRAVVMGQNFLVIRRGSIQVGDPVYVQYKD